MKKIKFILLTAAMAATIACGAGCSKGQTGGGNNTLGNANQSAYSSEQEEMLPPSDHTSRRKGFEFDGDHGLPEKRHGLDLIKPNGNFEGENSAEDCADDSAAEKDEKTESQDGEKPQDGKDRKGCGRRGHKGGKRHRMPKFGANPPEDKLPAEN